MRTELYETLKLHFLLPHKDCMFSIYCLCFTKACEVGGIFEPSSQDNWNMQKHCSLGLEKQSTDTYQISQPTAVFSTPWFNLFDPGSFFIVPENKHFYFHGTRQVEPFMLYCKEIFNSFYSNITGLLRSQVYLRLFVDFFCLNLILYNTIS